MQKQTQFFKDSIYKGLNKTESSKNKLTGCAQLVFEGMLCFWVIKIELNVDLDGLCLKEIKTLKINGLRNMFDQRKQEVTLNKVKCRLLKRRHKSIQNKKLKNTESLYSDIIV